VHGRLFRVRFALISLLVLGAPAVAHAAGEKDADAMKLHDQAMDEDYLAVEFDKAEKKLKDALKKCGKDGCSEKVVGKLHIALGTVYGGGGKLDQAKEEFVAALKADSKAALIDALTTPELAKAFKDAQKEAGSGSKPSGEEPSGEKPKKAEGDLAHTPPAEQEVNTPVPIYIEIPEDIGATKVTLRYKPFGTKKWKSLEMKAIGEGYGVEIPCKDVTTTGDIKYYIVAKDDADDPVGTAGSLKSPHKVPIKNDIDETPSLPGKKPPQKCAVAADCPPGLPGCESAGGSKPLGSSCDESQECTSGNCLNGTCEAGSAPDVDKGPKPKLNGASLWGQIDVLLINGKDTGVCSGNDDSYACFYPDDGGQFYGEPIDRDGTNGIQGGLGLAGGRVLLAYDRMISAKLPLIAGLRLGLAFGGSPSSDTPPPNELHSQAKTFLPLHVEARIGYMLGEGVIEKGKWHPYAFLAGGLAQVNASVQVNVCDRRDMNGIDPAAPGNEGSCPDGTRSVEGLDAYQITGLNFFAVGGGTTFGITPSVGVAAELKMMFMVPTFGIVFAPSIGPVFAF
jgi:hypothetical protein